jgi:hypothetical protein
MPLAALGAIATIGGTALSIAGNAKEQSAINAARNTETAQQSDIQRQANNITAGSIAASTPQVAQQQMQQGQANRMALTQDLQAAAAPGEQALPATGGGSARTQAAGNVWQNLVEGNQAKAGSYSDWENQQAIKNAQASQKLGILNNFSAGDASLLPVEEQVASQKGDALSGWGSIMSGLGNAATSYGIANRYNNQPTGGNAPAGWPATFN